MANSKEYKNNVFMHSVYYRELQNDLISDEIGALDLKRINEGLIELNVWLTSARRKVHELEYVGKDHTVRYFPNIRAKLDEMLRELAEVDNLVNKKGSRINLEKYPI